MDSGRSPEDICIIGVAKYVDVERTQMLFDAGCHHLGESRPQSLWTKAETISTSVPLNHATPRWHMIGHVQTNKLRRLLRYQPVIHSVDSERLIRAIQTEANRQGRSVDVLLEVNISGDEAKTGLPPDDVGRLLQIDDLDNVNIKGLMAMAGWGTDSNTAAEQFREVARLRDDLANSVGQSLDELSMGMSGDFSAAIDAGATMVRIGSALFEGVTD